MPRAFAVRVAECHSCRSRGQEILQNVARKLAIALAQHDDLSRSAQQLADDLFAGRKRHKTYRQLKMYNDPSLNPYLYKAKEQ